MDLQGWFPLGLTSLIFLLSKGPSRVLSSTTVQKHQLFGFQPSFLVQLSHPYMTTGKTMGLTIWTSVGKEMSLLFNTLSRSVIAFLPRSKHPLISQLQSLSPVILESKIKLDCVKYKMRLPSGNIEVMVRYIKFMGQGWVLEWTKKSENQQCIDTAWSHEIIQHCQSYLEAYEIISKML